VTENSATNLVATARNGDAESFRRLCEQHYPALVAIAYSQLADRSLAEDAAQEALLIAYRDITKLKETSRFLPWLAAICRNTASRCDPAKPPLTRCTKSATLWNVETAMDRMVAANCAKDTNRLLCAEHTI
jgi:hypothetical protein